MTLHTAAAEESYRQANDPMIIEKESVFPYKIIFPSKIFAPGPLCTQCMYRAIGDAQSPQLRPGDGRPLDIVLHYLSSRGHNLKPRMNHNT